MDLGRLGRFEADLTSPTLFKRCVICPPTPPPCPVCKSGQICSQVSGDCNSCPITMCIKSGSSDSSASSSPSPAGPIAGGVIGGLVFMAILTFLVWRFCIRKRRQAYDEQVWRDSAAEKVADAMARNYKRSSTQSVRSIASTVITRASNVIQIAYIPGVTNRTDDSSDLIPPVPPIPAMSISGTHSSGGRTPSKDEHFFMPADLRNSTFSDYTINQDQKSLAHTSIAPSRLRDSVPSTVYRESAIVNTVPAQTAIMGKANTVAVKANSAGRYSPSVASPVESPRSAGRSAASGKGSPAMSASPIVARMGVPKAVTVTRTNASPVATINPTGSISNSSQLLQPPSSVKGSASLSPKKPISQANSPSSTYDVDPDSSSSSEEEDEQIEQVPRKPLIGQDRGPRTGSPYQEFHSSRSSPAHSHHNSPWSSQHNLPRLAIPPGMRNPDHKRSISHNEADDAYRNGRRPMYHNGRQGSVPNIYPHHMRPAPQQRMPYPHGPPYQGRPYPQGPYQPQHPPQRRPIYPQGPPFDPGRMRRPPPQRYGGGQGPFGDEHAMYSS